MSYISKLMSSLPKVWNKDPLEEDLVILNDLSCDYSYLSIVDGYLYLHNEIDNLKDSIQLDLTIYTVGDLIGILGSYGLVTYSTYDLNLNKSALILNELNALNIKSMYFLNGNFIISIIPLRLYKSINWQVLYPIAIYLSRVKEDMTLSLKQLFLSSSSGQWVDYWGTFLNILREYNESDSSYIRKLFLYFINPKTNNIAMEEYLRILLGYPVSINDISPNLFSVVLPLDFIDREEEISNKINEIKACGVNFIIVFVDNTESLASNISLINSSLVSSFYTY